VIQKSLEPSPSNFIDVVTEPGFVDSVLRTLKICVMSTAIAVLLGYPFAYAMAAGGRLIRIVLVASLLMTTWTSLLIRTYAITILFDDKGVLNNFLTSTNIIDDPLPLIRNQFAVTAATVQILLPFVILPVFLRLRSFDPQLVEAAASLGGRRISVFWRVILPLTIPSVAAGAVLGFILSVGFFIVAQLVGSPGDYLVSQGVAEQINSYFAPNVAAAMSAVLLLIVVAFLLLIYALLRIGKFGGVSEIWRDNK
jgi:ABC-type spermidine/putrescine transport system permease subunit I